MSTCINCNKKDANINFQVYTWNGLGKSNVDFVCCSEECKKEVEEFSEYVNKNAVKFLILILSGAFSFVPFLFLGVFIKNNIFGIMSMSCPLIIIGITVIKYPFSTPETNSFFGIRKTIKLTRIIGIIFIVISILIPIIIYLIGY